MLNWIFGTHTAKSEPHLGGAALRLSFANGYGASVIQHDFSYGREDGRWELAVVGPDGHLDYTTPITDNVLGYLDTLDVAVALDAIEALPPKGG